MILGVIPGWRAAPDPESRDFRVRCGACHRARVRATHWHRLENHLAVIARRPSIDPTAGVSLRRYDRGCGAGWLDVISPRGLATIRLQRLPEQKKRPSTQASTRSELAPFIAMVP